MKRFGAADAAATSELRSKNKNVYPCLNVWVMQIDGATDSKERETERWKRSDCLSVL